MSDINIPKYKDISIVKSKINQKFNNQQEETCCALCNKELKNNSKSFHKSHTVPFFCLENIKGIYNKNYGVLNGNFACMRTPFSDKEFIGTNKAGVFYSICSKCDQEKFSIYESEEALLKLPPKELVDSLALKVYLNELFNSRLRNFKATINHSELTDDQLISEFFSSVGKIEQSAIAADIQDFKEDLDFAKTSFEKGYSNYRIIYNSILDYTVPIAAQVAIPISKNVDYSKLQTVNVSNKKRLEDILVCIFPLKEKSVIIVFSRIDNRLIKKYSKQFKKLSNEDKLKEIFYLLIRYKASNFFYSPLLKDILENENIRGVCSIEDTGMVLGDMTIDLADFEDRSWKRNLPSLLAKEYSIQVLSSQK